MSRFVKHKLCTAIIGAIALLIASASSSSAATYTWTGATNTGWLTGSNWSPAGPPTSSDTAVIDLGGNGPVVTTSNAAAGTTEVGTDATGGTLTVQGGGVLIDANGYLGYNAGATGAATITGAGSIWTNSANFNVGQWGTGTLSVTSGGILNDTNLYTFVGADTGSQGTVTIDGSGSQWKAVHIYIGLSGTGTLTISNGGTISNSGDDHIGTTSGSIGTATITGPGSSWISSGSNYVGDRGIGTLTVSDGASTSGHSTELGYGAGSSGIATIAGSGSTMTAVGDINVGLYGTGTLDIENGGTVSVVHGDFIADHTGSIGAATVMGNGSEWISNSDFYIGGSGVGSLTIADGGVVRAGGGQSYTNTVDNSVTTSSNTAYIAYSPGSVGTLNIGAAAGNAAAAPGTLSAAKVAFGAGTGTLVFNHTSANYVFSPAISGNGAINVLSGGTILTGDLSAFTGSIREQGGSITTPAAQQASMPGLGADQRATAIESRATVGELLGMTRPVTQERYAYAGGMFGSNVGYIGGQYSRHGITLLGGLAYGTQDYPGVRQSGAPTVALAGRYSFDDPFHDAAQALHPYGEIGAWATPRETLTLSRPYADFATGALDMGQGATAATAGAAYGRAGLAWDADRADQVAGYGELGQQWMSFAPYAEASSPSNPFPASVAGGVFRMGVARVGGSWTRDLSRDIYAPISITLAGDVARSFDVHSGLVATIPGLAPMQVPDSADTWGEFGMRVQADLTRQLALNLDLNGTTGGGALGTAVHGGAGLSYSY